MNEAVCAVSPDEALAGVAAIEQDKIQRSGFAAALSIVNQRGAIAHGTSE